MEMKPCPFCRNIPFTHDCEEMANGINNLETICLYADCPIAGVGIEISKWNARTERESQTTDSVKKNDAIHLANTLREFSLEYDYIEFIGHKKDKRGERLDPSKTNKLYIGLTDLMPPDQGIQQPVECVNGFDDDIDFSSVPTDDAKWLEETKWIMAEGIYSGYCQSTITPWKDYEHQLELYGYACASLDALLRQMKKRPPERESVDDSNWRAAVEERLGYKESISRGRAIEIIYNLQKAKA